jgi:hypothetical protein
MTIQTMLRHIAGMTLIGLALLPRAGSLGQSPQVKRMAVPKMWDDAAMSTLEIPLANPIGSPKQAPAAYYYRIPVRTIYKQYPVYAPGREPAGYMEWLKHQEPVIVWDETSHKPELQAEADWIKAGEIVFSAPTGTAVDQGFIGLADVQSAAWYEHSGMPITKEGVLPFVHYIIREKGKVELGSFSCAMCHTRVMPGGTILKGAQGNFPFERAAKYSSLAHMPAPLLYALNRQLYAAPWLHPDPLDVEKDMTVDEITEILQTIPPGVISRHRASSFTPVQVPDLIGVKERHYLDRTGLQPQRSIVDLMRYGALNQGGDFIASFDGFIPADFPEFKKLPDPTGPEMTANGRYNDEQLYAMALYVYSLKPPPNPNKFDAPAARGEKLFTREGCSVCHTAPLYTNNELTPAEGFTIPADHQAKYEILPISVGTDPSLTLKTRRGTGYYKVPSLKGVWYRSMFGHSGWCATLEDWLDPARLNDDYIPTGFKPYGAKTYAVKGHPFGLNLTAQEKKDLIAFLKTL